MKVAMVRPYSGSAKGAGDEYVQRSGEFQIAEALRKLGVNVTFFIPSRKKEIYTKYIRGVKVVFCPTSLVLRAPTWRLSTICLTEPHTYGDITLLYEFSLPLFREVRKFNPDLIHLYGYFFTNLLMIPFSRMISVPVVIEPLGTLHRREPIRGEVTSLFLRRATRIFAWERAELHYLREHGVPEEKITLIPVAGFNEDYFFPKDKSSCRARLGLSEKYTYLLYVGCIYPEGYIKDPFELLYVLKLLNALEGKRYKLIVVGKGLREKYLARAEKLGVKEDLIMAGFIESRELLNTYYNAADVFLWPWPQDISGGVGSAFTEAMACGLPIVSYSGVRSKKDDCVVYVPYRDRRAMAEGVIELINDEKRRNRLVKNSLAKARNEFSFSKLAQRRKTEYLKLIK